VSAAVCTELRVEHINISTVPSVKEGFVMFRAASNCSALSAGLTFSVGTLAIVPVAERVWRQLHKTLFDTYRPELHYMRGPGPKWREKHGAPQAARTGAIMTGADVGVAEENAGSWRLRCTRHIDATRENYAFVMCLLMRQQCGARSPRFGQPSNGLDQRALPFRWCITSTSPAVVTHQSMCKP
jgi:hypothetical protein